MPRVLRPRTIMVGIVGDSASGKTTLTRGLVNLFGGDHVSAICCDAYHRYNRQQRKGRAITALHPACNYIDIMEQHFTLLRAGQPILKPVYNHAAGDFDPPEYVQPFQYVIVEGLLGFHTRAMRNCFDIKVFLSPPEAMRREWKIQRDTGKRGYTREQVLDALAHREPDSEAFIRPQRALSDIVVQFYPPEGRTYEPGMPLNARLVLWPTLPHPDFEDFLEPTRHNGGPCVLSMALGRFDDKPADILAVSANISADETAALRKRLRAWLLPEYLNGQVPEGTIGVYHDGKEYRQSYPLAFTQLLIAYHMIKAKEVMTLEVEEPEKRREAVLQATTAESRLSVPEALHL